MLEQIKDILESSTSTWRESIEEQLDMVKREQERLKTLEEALIGILYSIDLEGEANWPIIFSIIKLYQQDPLDALEHYKSYLNEEDMKKVMDMNLAQMSEEDIKEWMEVISEINNNLDINPGSEKAGQLVERWLNQVENMFGDDEKLLGDMWEALQNLKDGIAFYPMNKDVIQFIERVFQAREKS